MKVKALSLFLSFLVALSTVVAAPSEGTTIKNDVSQYSTEELLQLRSLIDDELVSRGEEAVPDQQTYILNTNSKRFHLPSCDALERTKEYNKKEYQGSREELVSRGYTPCGICNP